MNPRLALVALACSLPIAAQTYRIAGVVVDSATGAAVDRVKVGIAPISERTRAVYVTTGSDGRFAFANLPANNGSSANSTAPSTINTAPAMNAAR